MAQYPIVPRPGGNSSVLDITAATVVKASPGTLFTISFVSGTAGVTVYDSTSTSGNTAADEVYALTTSTVGQVVSLTWPCASGIVVVPGASTVVAVAYA